MDVIVSSGGIFQAYHVARGAAAGGYLRRFIVGIYDRRERGIDPALFRKEILPGYLGQIIQYIPNPNSQPISYIVRDNLFDLLARQHVTKCDLFHGWNHMSLFSGRKAKKLGAKYIVDRSSAHPLVQDAILREEYAKYNIRYPAAASWVFRKHLQEYEEADAITVPSEFVARTMREQGIPEAKIRKIYWGFEPTRFKAGEKTDSVFRIIFVGSVSLQKGVQYLLEAYKRLNLPNSELIFVGSKFQDSGSFLPKYEGLYRHVPFVPQRELPSFYHAASVFVLPSLQDGFGMVVYEAAACGLPVIVTNNVGAEIRDGQDGFVIPIRDPDTLADRLLCLYQDEKLRREMGESARQYVQQFTWERYHQELAEHYRAIMGTS